MKKYLVSVLVVCTMLLSGCSNGGDDLKNFTQDQLKEQAITVIDEYNAKAYEKTVQRFQEDLRTQITSRQLQGAWDENFKDAGPFKEYDTFSYAEKENNGFVVALVKYENTTVQFTLSFNTNMELTNFFIK